MLRGNILRNPKPSLSYILIIQGRIFQSCVYSEYMQISCFSARISNATCPNRLFRISELLTRCNNSPQFRGQLSYIFRSPFCSSKNLLSSIIVYEKYYWLSRRNLAFHVTAILDIIGTIDMMSNHSTTTK